MAVVGVVPEPAPQRVQDVLDEVKITAVGNYGPEQLQLLQVLALHSHRLGLRVQLIGGTPPVR